LIVSRKRCRKRKIPITPEEAEMMADEAGADEDAIIVYASPYKVLFNVIVNERSNNLA
jgi:hypothetical protein